jgi:hypothetical protein
MIAVEREHRMQHGDGGGSTVAAIGDLRTQECR